MILASNNIAVLYETTLKSAPQFIIELYAMVAQKGICEGSAHCLSAGVFSLLSLGVYSRG